MKLDRDQIKRTIENCNNIGYDVRVSDIAYVCLLNSFKEYSIAYAAIFGRSSSKSEIESYNESEKIKFLKNHVSDLLSEGEARRISTDDIKATLTFEENKDGLINLLGKVQEMAATGELEKKDAIKLETEIRTKLNDKFQVQDEQEERRVVVLAKYNAVCKCGREIYRPAKEELLKELKQFYDLVPKRNK